MRVTSPYCFTEGDYDLVKQTVRKLRTESNKLESIMEIDHNRCTNRDAINRVYERLLAYYNALTPLLEVYSEAAYFVNSQNVQMF